MTRRWAEGQIKDPGTKIKIMKRWVMCLHHNPSGFAQKHTMFLLRKGLSRLPEHKISYLSICLYAYTTLYRMKLTIIRTEKVVE